MQKETKVPQTTPEPRSDPPAFIIRTSEGKRSSVPKEQAAEYEQSKLAILDAITSPKHYTNHPSGIEPIQITAHESFLRGNIIKYVMRAPYKGRELEDLRKARQYLDWEIERLESLADGKSLTENVEKVGVGLAYHERKFV